MRPYIARPERTDAGLDLWVEMIREELETLTKTRIASLPIAIAKV